MSYQLVRRFEVPFFHSYRADYDRPAMSNSNLTFAIFVANKNIYIDIFKNNLVCNSMPLHDEKLISWANSVITFNLIFNKTKWKL